MCNTVNYCPMFNGTKCYLMKRNYSMLNANFTHWGAQLEDLKQRTNSTAIRITQRKQCTKNKFNKKVISLLSVNYIVFVSLTQRNFIPVTHLYLALLKWTYTKWLCSDNSETKCLILNEGHCWKRIIVGLQWELNETFPSNDLQHRSDLKNDMHCIKSIIFWDMIPFNLQKFTDNF
jgi:hypothetical protein